MPASTPASTPASISTPTPADGRYTYLDHLPADFSARTLRADVRVGLTAARKWLPPKWFYDKVGSELFEEITRLPEYYPTRAEREILRREAGVMIRSAGCDTLVELGSGSSEKTRLLLDELTGRAPADPLARPGYVALDVSEDALRGACAGLARQYPVLRIEAVRADFEHQLHLLPAGSGHGRRLVAFLGGTIGNFPPAQRIRFLASLRDQLSPGDHLLLGADLVKSAEVLVPAYDDAAGVTAAFNLNLLDVLNRRLSADFDRTGFAHRAVWDPEHEWIEMRLRAVRPMTVQLPAVGLTVRFDAGEELRTEISAKFRQEGLSAELVTAGFAARGWWTDEAGRFSVSLWAVAPARE
jgi:L-histidine N-alpha-methyltransferase